MSKNLPNFTGHVINSDFNINKIPRDTFFGGIINSTSQLIKAFTDIIIYKIYSHVFESTNFQKNMSSQFKKNTCYSQLPNFK